MRRKAYYIINGITLYRLLMAPVLILLIFIHDEVHVFKWLLGISFFTDLIDGWLATLVLILLVLFIIQTVLALIRYGKLSSFHTYSAKYAALM